MHKKKKITICHEKVVSEKTNIDLVWIIIYIFIYIDTFLVEKLEELACRAHFSNRS
jgi:hypothetical protein